MPVSFLPCLTPLFLIGVPLLLRFKSRRAAKIAAVCSACSFVLLVLAVYLPGWWLYAQAAKGDPAGQYRYAQWLENHSEQIGAIVLWPSKPDVLGGYEWLERAADQGFPPAVWLVGVRLKHGIHVPKPQGWPGPDGNVYPQPERGQEMIDRAVHRLGFQPPASEESYYWQRYRHGFPP